MKIEKYMEQGYSSYKNRFNLLDANKETRGIPIGVLLLYIIYNLDDFDFSSLFAEEDTDHDMMGNILRIDEHNEERELGRIKDLSDSFLDLELNRWMLYGKYKGVKIQMSGYRDSSIISVIYPLEMKLDLKSVMEEVEKKTYQFPFPD